MGAWLAERGRGLLTPPPEATRETSLPPPPRCSRHAARRSLGPLPAAPRGPAGPGPARPRHGASAGSCGARGELGGSVSGRGVPVGVTLPPADAAAVPAGDRRRFRRHVRRVPGPRRLGAGSPGGLQEARRVNRGLNRNRDPHRDRNRNRDQHRDQERDQEWDQEWDQRPRAVQAPRPNKGR